MNTSLYSAGAVAARETDEARSRAGVQARYASDEARFAALAQRDREADGVFYYSVRSTGVYCRPSCAARPALRRNVAFHASAADAEQAGFRPCQRCRPDLPPLAERQAAAVAKACRLIEASDNAPDLDSLAETSGMSRFHFHRVFKHHTGVTPKAYATAWRAGRLVRQLNEGASVTDALYQAGYGSSGRFYADAPARLGMTPTVYRGGGAGETIRFAIGACSLGAILVAASARGICAILMGDDPDQLVRDLQDRFPKAELVGADAAFESSMAAVIGLVEAPQRGLALPLDVRGTAFQQRVWEALRAVPSGSTVSYAELAARLGMPTAARAIAGACAANPVAVAIPCHRVVRQDGALSGYRWGVERKRELLARESKA